MNRIFYPLSLLLFSSIATLPEAQAGPTFQEIDPRWAPESLGKPPRPGDTGSEPPGYGDEWHVSFAHDFAAIGGIVGGTIIPMAMIMGQWNEAYDERSLDIKPAQRETADELLRTYGRTSAIVAPLATWGGFMAGGGYRQYPVRALLCGIGASAVAYPLGNFLGRKVADPVTNAELDMLPRYPDRTMFLGSLVLTGVITSGTIAGVVVGGGPLVGRDKDAGYSLNVVQDGDQTLWVHSLQGRF